MHSYYTVKEAMAVLGFASRNAFLQLTRKYPSVFMNVNLGTGSKKRPWYDKAKVDQFQKMREYLKQENHEHTYNRRKQSP